LDLNLICHSLLIKSDFKILCPNICN